MRRKNKSIYIVLIVVALIGITIGYAVINTTLNINGKSSISKNTWDVYFDNVVVKDDSVEAVKIPTVTDKTTVDFEVALNLPGDYYEFTVDVVNNGTIDAMIESIEKFPELSEEQAKYLNYTVTYENGEAITTKQLVKKEEFVRLKVREELRKDILKWLSVTHKNDIRKLANNFQNIFESAGIDSLIDIKKKKRLIFELIEESKNMDPEAKRVLINFIKMVIKSYGDTYIGEVKNKIKDYVE